MAKRSTTRTAFAALSIVGVTASIGYFGIGQMSVASGWQRQGALLQADLATQRPAADAAEVLARATAIAKAASDSLAQQTRPSVSAVLAGGGSGQNVQVATPAVSNPSAPQELTSRDAIVRLRSIGCNSIATGSGFALKGVGVITNRHVADPAVDLQAESWDGHNLGSLAINAIGDNLDVAVLETNAAVDSNSALELAGLPARQGEAITVIGYPLGGQYTETAGTVFGWVDDGHGNRMLELDVEAQPGNSGGPVLDRFGKVVGVIYAKRTDNGHPLAVSADSLNGLTSHVLPSSPHQAPC